MGISLAFAHLPPPTQALPPPTMTKIAFFAALLLAIGMVYAEDANVNELPLYEPAEGSGLVVHATLEERCCLGMV
ncbi:hypothetical protein DVH05_020200 [Phytophthora capsici]|nr:hypothetical protein DVH05_020200 [Phytophthora capsici]